MTHKKDFHPERGSVFFFIMIGIALFATISFVVTQSLRSGTDSSGSPMGTAERNTVAVTSVMQFMDALKMQIFTLTSTNNVPEAKLDFKNNVYMVANGTAVFGGNSNLTCGGAPDCSVFSPYSPTGLVPMPFPNAADAIIQTCKTCLRNGNGRSAEISLNGVGTAAPELIFLIQGISPSICNLYNQKQGITTAYTTSTTLTSIGESSGSSVPAAFNGFTTTNTFGFGATAFAGKKSFCAPSLGDSNVAKLGIWHVLLAR